MPEFARLSTYLRVYGHVSHPDDKFLDDDEDIAEKRREAEVIKRRILGNYFYDKSDKMRLFIFHANSYF